MKDKLEFKISWTLSFIPMLIFFAICMIVFVIFKVFDMHVLAAGGFIGLIIGSMFVKDFENFNKFWNSVVDGVSSRTSIEVVVILFIIGIFSQLMKSTNVSGGFLWLSEKIGMKGGIFVAFSFLSCCILSTATGSSIGTLFAAFPIFYESGVSLGANPMFLAGALMGGCIFGDNLAPISDTTIASSNTQTFKHNRMPADVTGVVGSRLKYSLVAGSITLVLFAILGGRDGGINEASEILVDPKPLLMLIPVVILIIVAIKTSNIYASVSTGIILGTIVGLSTGLITLEEVFHVKDGTIVGFIPDGVANMMGTVTLVISVFGIMGVLQNSGALDKLVNSIYESKLGETVRGTELAIGIGIVLTTLLFGGVTSASILTFGPIANKLGEKADIHPYRRANLLDGFAHGIPHNIPFLSVFVFIGSALSGLPPSTVAKGSIYTLMLFLVFLIAVLTGWGLKYEGPNGEELDKPLNNK